MSAKKYFLYELKKSLFPIVALALIVSVVTVTGVFAAPTESGMPRYGMPQTGVGYAAVWAGLLAAFVPVWVFGYKTKKRSVDLYYSLPLSNMQILCVKYFIGLIAIVAPFTVGYFLGALSATVHYASGVLSGGYYMLTYLACLPSLFCVYSICAFAFTRANRLLDGLVFIGLWIILPLFFFNFIARVIDYDVFPEGYLCFSPLSLVAQNLGEYIVVPIKHLPLTLCVEEICAVTAVSAWAVAACVLTFVLEKKFKAENTGGISDSYFGYRTVLPIITLSLIGSLNLGDYISQIILFVVTCAVSYLMTVLYRRSFKIGKRAAIVFAASVLCGLIFAIVL